MIVVLITALGVGGATVIGALIGFLFKNISTIWKFNSLVILVYGTNARWSNFNP